MNRFVICTGCNHIRSLADMARDGKCIYRRRPHLASPPLPSGFEAVTRPPQDALDAMVRRVKEAQG